MQNRLNVNRFVCKSSPAMILISGISIFASMVLGVVLFTGWEIDQKEEFYWVMAMFIFFLVSGLGLGMSSLKYRLTISEEYIEERNAFKRNVKLNYDEVDRAVFSFRRGTLTVFGNNKAIKLNNAINNIEKGLEVMFRHVSKERIEFE